MAVEFPDRLHREFRKQGVMDAQIDFRADFRIGVDKDVERVRDDTLRGVFNRHAAIVGAPVVDVRENVVDVALGHVGDAVPEFGDRRQMGE